MRETDWTALQSDLVEYIGSLLIADDLTDFIRFRAVCHPWRSSSEQTKSRADCLLPRNWIMLSNPKLSPTEPIEFYNTSTHKSFWFDLTSYLDRYSLARSFACLILLKKTRIEGFFALLNPFMRSIIQLPSKVESNSRKAPSRIKDVYVTSSSTIVFRFSTLYNHYLFWTKPGDQSLMYAEYKAKCSSNVLFFEDRIFFFDSNKGVVQINFSNEMSSQPQVEVVIPDRSLWHSPHLFDCNGNIFMVCFVPEYAYEEEYIGEPFEVYKLDPENKTYANSKNLGDYSIFLGANRTFSVSYKNNLIPANCIYFCNQYYSENTRYNLSTDQLKFSKEPLLRPNSLVKKLISFCLRPNPIYLHGEDGCHIYNYED